MKLYPSFEVDDQGRPALLARARAEGAGIVGDMGFVVEPGETAAGLTYAEWFSAAQENRAIDAPRVWRPRGRERRADPTTWRKSR